ncbi:hypothetical protein GF339_18135 [candidate division KSB3 bacterium]|uniref:Uncharacterized protein n=1 Tax=candidate division KSB3 bacterium TaxID=2044937 RepID=A0A9D5JYF1_9BACT|nr:hypothetical protein [candidate division KSB3 bacterium]MBD3326509.1 hypothetical protein [candidate division KSB3 bacterium]
MLNGRQQLVWDRTFMAFGSVMKAMAGNIEPDDWQTTANEVWKWAAQKTHALAGRLFAEAEEENTENGYDAEHPVRFITEKQRKRFYAIAKGAGFSNDALKLFLVKRGISSSGMIPVDRYEQICRLAGNPSTAKYYETLIAGNNGNGEVPQRKRTAEQVTAAAQPIADDVPFPEEEYPEELDPESVPVPPPPDVDDDIPF